MSLGKRNQPPLCVPSGGAFPQLGWQPMADVYRTRYGWLIKMDLAGVRLEDIRFTLHGNHVLVEGVRRDCTLEEGGSYHSLEISYCRFQRRVEIPTCLEGSKVHPDYRDGMLILRLELATPHSGV